MQTMIISPTYGDIVFDAVFRANHDFTVVATEHPIQSGASITDHAYIEPEKVTLSVGMSDVMGDTDGRSADMFKQLKDMMRLREPVTIVTRFGSYTDMLLVQLTVPDEHLIMTGLKAELTFQHIEIVTAQIVKVQARIMSSKSDTVESNIQQSTGEYDDVYDFGNFGNSAAYAIGQVADWLFTSTGASFGFTERLDSARPTVAGDVVEEEDIKVNSIGVLTYQGNDPSVHADPIYCVAPDTYFYIGP